MVSKQALILLRSQLPTGAAVKIQERLSKKGIIKSVSMIIRVLNPEDDAANNEDILNEAILLRDEYLSHLAEIESRILKPAI